MTGGRVAYVYLPDTAFGGFTNFTRYFFAQVDKQAVIVDERFNGGGALATDIIEFLNRKLLSSVATRDGGDEVRAAGRDLRTEGDDDQRIRRLGRRCHAVVLPPRRRRQADRQADLGRPGRPRRLAAADGRRLRHAPRHPRCGIRTAESVDRRERRHQPRHRSRARSGSWYARATTRSSNEPFRRSWPSCRRIRRRNWCGRSFRHTAPSNSNWRMRELENW